VSRSDDDIAMGVDEHEELWPVNDSDYSSDQCDSCTCCTARDCVPAKCGEDDYGRFHCPCTSE
jgi:hypothetical protein